MGDYKKPNSLVSKDFEAKSENLEIVQDYIFSTINKELTIKERNELLIVIEEIFINIASYAYKETGSCTIETNFENNVLTLIFKDSGVRFNPLDKDDPNTSLEAEERRIGGLGIFMVKKLMDECYYEFEDNKNCLILIKKYQ